MRIYFENIWTFFALGLSNLVKYLPLNSTLKDLSLAYCDINEKGVQYLGDLITKSPSLEKLILMGNPIKDEGVSDLVPFYKLIIISKKLILIMLNSD